MLNKEDKRNLAVQTALAAAATALFVIAMMTDGEAHDALPTAAQPEGWAYSYSCCAQNDCRAVPDSAIGETPTGFVIKKTGEVIAYDDKRLKDSPDGQYHWCSVAGADDSRTICLYRAPRGF